MFEQLTYIAAVLAVLTLPPVFACLLFAWARRSAEREQAAKDAYFERVKERLGVR